MHPILIEAVARAHRDDLLRTARAQDRAAHLTRSGGSRFAGLSSSLLQAVTAHRHRASTAGACPVPCC
ncbi:hypothetical protein SAMN05421678_11616 [Actinopolymorpha cephalotaxi]|uniref:Uncharacterized protein n=1 Tax=Actinopolymorpha cephalotaxi TaxID=504797 RepID=A0A1I2ZBV0_9ACTN|nr:hypothetical protein [Actinopolymorpha cephalotaxi]NYH81903.1 hypothetical protein [Actinopolymorpha cephalotaxi]SFH35342.1 hypothetical protein SAMN05421678_11616 [Actinopolymorpha cephalotaxi]